MERANNRAQQKNRQIHWNLLKTYIYFTFKMSHNPI